jgi:AcrR family transcriptional regulator
VHPAEGSRRGRILVAAIQAFARSGFDGASTREIAEAAGVTDPLVFYHFGSKAGLYLAAVQDQLEKLRDGLDAALDGAADARARLRVFVEVYLAYFLDLEPGLTVTLREINGLPADTAAAISATHHDAVTARLEGILAGGVADGVFRPLHIPASALAITGILQVFIRSAARNPGRFTREDAVAQVLDCYVAGLRPDASVE